MASHDEARDICQALGRGVTRSKRQAVQWARKAADNGHAVSCRLFAELMYLDLPYAREIGHVGGGAAGVATTAGGIDGHDIPPDVRTGVIFWLRKGRCNLVDELDRFRRFALRGTRYCYNIGCEVVGHLKDFKVCPQCKTARYCGDACQKLDWTAGGHKATCGTYESKFLGLHS